MNPKSNVPDAIPLIMGATDRPHPEKDWSWSANPMISRTFAQSSPNAWRGFINARRVNYMLDRQGLMRVKFIQSVASCTSSGGSLLLVCARLAIPPERL